MTGMQAASLPPQSPIAPIVARATGATFAVDARTIVATRAAAGQFREQIADVLGSRLPLAVRVTGLRRDAAAQNLFESVCSLLAAASGQAAAAGNRVEVAIAADSLSPRAAWLSRKRLLGDGPLYLLAGEELLGPRCGHDRGERNDRFWSELWQLSRLGCVRLACSRHVESRCPLLSAERAGVVLPRVGIQAPVASAWATMHLDLTRFADMSGAVNTTALQAALERCVDLGEALHDRTVWPTAGMRHDSWLNRRLAIDITGIGDLVVRWRDDPRSFACLQRLGALLREVRLVLQRRSAMLAKWRGNLPALHCADPTWMLPVGRDRDSWQKRWRAALDEHAARHRNLLVLSPSSLFPRHGHSDATFFDLLPLLDYADACAFPATATFQGWDSNEFRRLHERAWAVLERRDGRRLIAEPV